MTDKILLQGLEFFGRHGVLPEEQTLGQRFVVDLELELDLQPAGKTDDLDLTVNYAEVYEKVKEVAEGAPFRLIETLADAIVARVLEDDRVQAVTVQIRKPGAPIPGIFDFVGVKIRRSR